MDQVVRFFGFMLLGIAAALIFISLAALTITEGWAEVGRILSDPLNVALLFSFFLPGAILYGIGALMRPRAEAEEAASKTEKET